MFFAAMPSFGGSISFVRGVLIYIAKLVSEASSAKGFLSARYPRIMQAHVSTMRMLSHKFTAPTMRKMTGNAVPLDGAAVIVTDTVLAPVLALILPRSASKITVNYIATNCVPS